MEKVVTIMEFNNLKLGDKTVVKEYPELNKYLDDGYKIKQAFHSVTKDGFSSSITFILSK